MGGIFRLLALPKKRQSDAKVGGDQKYLVSTISTVGGDAPHGSRGVVAPMLAIKTSRVRSPAGAWLSNDSGQVVHFHVPRRRRSTLSVMESLDGGTFIHLYRTA